MADRSRWGFAGLSDEEYDDFVRGGADRETVHGAPARERDAAPEPEPLRVDVDDAGRATAVVLASDWRSRIEPGSLGVVALHQLHAQVARRLLAAAEEAPPSSTPVRAPVDLTPWNGDLRRLAEEARADARRLRAAVEQHRASTTTVHSADGHLRGQVRGSDIVDLAADEHWSGQAHRLDVETELLDVLRRLQTAAAPDRLTQGPVSGAAHVVGQLVRDPHALTRSAGLIP